MTYTPPKYPTDIPDTSDLRTVTDDVSFYMASDINDKRDELIAVMTELGTLPKGSYMTVKDRLDAQENRFVDRGGYAIYDYFATSFTKDGQSHVLDMSDKIPDGVTAVLFHVFINGTVGHTAKFAKYNYFLGGNCNTMRNLSAQYGLFGDLVVGVSSDKKINYSFTAGGTWSTIGITIGGWWF